jgi:hypothetical protein
MKIFRIALFWIAILIFVIGQEPDTIVNAAQAEYCSPPEIKIARPDIFKNNYWIYSAIKVKPNFVLDYYQDPDRNGVDITVVIESAELVVTYSKWEDVCLLYETHQEGMTPCKYDGKPIPGMRFSYWTRTCVPQPPETAYRSIDPGSVSVWLDATVQTRSLLGPGPYFGDTKKPVLRYLYPDQWALKKVSSGEMKIVERPGFNTAEDVIDFLKKNKDYVILESDAKSYLLGTRMQKTYAGAMNWPAIALMDSGSCVAGKNTTGLDAGITALAGGERICTFESDTFKGAVYKYVITMKGIPLDLPGEWYIGASFFMEYASFDNGHGHEPGKSTGIIFERSDEEMESRYSFESYILRSAPCNPDEPGGCWDID